MGRTERNHVLWRDGGSVASVGGNPWEVEGGGSSALLCSALVGNRLWFLVVARICMHASSVGIFTFFVEGEIYSRMLLVGEE